MALTTLAALFLGGCPSSSSISVIGDLSGSADGALDIIADSPCPDCGTLPDVELPDVAMEMVETSDLGCQDCGEPLVCEPDDGMCEGNAVTVCLEDGSGWGLPEACPALTTCADGECLPWPDGQCDLALACMETFDCQTPEQTCVDSCLKGVAIGVGVHLNEVFWCVVETCASWDPTSECFGEARLGECKPLFEACTGVCATLCDGKECGPDSCGGQCGECEAGYACDPMGHCLCQPECDGKECGPNGCGALCGLCAGRKPVCNEEVGLCEKEPPGPCGNEVCEPELGETCFNCGYDCGDCPPCGDGACDEGEQCDFCPADCGPCTYGDCCAYHDFAGCEDAAVVDCVCAIEPDCCLGPWHNDCVLVADDCGADCG